MQQARRWLKLSLHRSDSVCPSKLDDQDSSAPRTYDRPPYRSDNPCHSDRLGDRVVWNRLLSAVRRLLAPKRRESGRASSPIRHSQRRIHRRSPAAGFGLTGLPCPREPRSGIAPEREWLRHTKKRVETRTWPMLACVTLRNLSEWCGPKERVILPDATLTRKD